MQQSGMKTQFGQNRFRVLEVGETDEEEQHVRAVECIPCGDLPKRDYFEDGTGVNGRKTGAFGLVEVYRGTRPGARTSVPLASTHAYTDPQPGTRRELDMKATMDKMKGEVNYVCAVGNKDELVDLGVGDIVVDSAADESCWPVGHGDAFPTKKSSRVLRLRTANGADMTRYGEKEITFKYKGGENREAVGIKFQVTDVKKPLLAVRRLVERGCVVTMAEGEGESFISHKESKMKIPIVKKGGSLVIEARFVKKVMAEGFQRQA